MKIDVWTMTALAVALVCFACLAHVTPFDAGLLGASLSHAPLSLLASVPAVGMLQRKDDNGGGDDGSIGEIGRKLGAIVGNVKKFGEETKESLTEMKARLLELEQKAAREPGDGTGQHSSSVGELFVKHELWDPSRVDAKGGLRLSIKRDLKAALVGINGFVTGSGNTTYPAAPEHIGLIPGALPQVRLLDALPRRPVSTDSIDFVQLTSTGGSDYQEGQGSEKSETDFSGTIQTAKVQTIAVHTTVAKQLLNDTPGLQDQIDQMFRNDLAQKVQRELLIGDGGTFHIPGLIGQATAVSGVAGAPADRIGLVAAQMDDAGYTPSLIVLNRTDWFGIQITKDDNGNYMFGSPTSGVPAALWGIRIVVAPNVPSHTALVIDTSKVKVLDREEPSLYVTRDHKDYATKNLVLLLAELRVGLAVYDTLGVRKLEIAE